MKKLAFLLSTILAGTTAFAQSEYDLNQPFGFCTQSSRTTNTPYNITGGGCYSYPVPAELEANTVVLTSTGADMKGTIQNAIKNGNNKVIILDGSKGDFIVSSNVGITASGKTILGINNARIRTKWEMTQEIKDALDKAEVPNMNTSGNGGKLPNGQSVSEQAEYNTRKIIIEMTGDNDENYRNSGILSLVGCQNIIIRNITFIGPGAVDVGGSDLISSSNGAKNIWVDHCAFQDGMDGNFDITQKADFHTVSWCTFSYSNRSYMHQNTNLIGSSDSETTGYLNTTFAFNWWGTGCKARMPMARVGKIHMLNNYYSTTTGGNCINPRKNSEFLIEGNYIDTGVKSFYSQSGATAVTWVNNNYIASGSTPDSKGATVTVPYAYTVVAAANVKDAVKTYAGATLKFEGGDTPVDPPSGTAGSIVWAFDTGADGQAANVQASITEGIQATSVTLGSDLAYDGKQTALGETKIQDRTTNFPSTAASDANAITFKVDMADGYQFLATDVSVTATRLGTDAGKIDISWTDAGGTTALCREETPSRDNGSPNVTTYPFDLQGKAVATETSCSLIINMYGVTTGYKKDSGGNPTTEINYKDYGFKDIVISGYLINTSTGIATPVTLAPVTSTEYYNLAGQRIYGNVQGLVIERQRTADGRVTTKKVIKR